MKFLRIPSGLNWQDPTNWFAFGFGSGLMRLAPGTWGTAAAVVPYLLWMTEFNIKQYLIVTLLTTVVGFLICHSADKEVQAGGGKEDDSAIVFDEWVGFFITMAFLPTSWIAIVVGFLTFRLFDAFKKGPVGWIDRAYSGGFGIMADDVVAGLMAGVVSYTILRSLGLL